MLFGGFPICAVKVLGTLDIQLFIFGVGREYESGSTHRADAGREKLG
jgi:hypothetical protein